MKDFAYCSSPHKQKGLCETCKRNIDLQDITNETELSSEWKPQKVKNFKTKTTKYRCEGYYETSN